MVEIWSSLIPGAIETTIWFVKVDFLTNTIDPFSRILLGSCLDRFPFNGSDLFPPYEIFTLLSKFPHGVHNIFGGTLSKCAVKRIIRDELQYNWQFRSIITCAMPDGINKSTIHSIHKNYHAYQFHAMNNSFMDNEVMRVPRYIIKDIAVRYTN